MTTCKCKRPKWIESFNNRKAKQWDAIELRCVKCRGLQPTHKRGN